MAGVPDSTEKRTVLVVDDEPGILHVLNELLKNAYRVRVASNGVQALKAAQQEPRPDAILLDIMMPDMDGFEVCRQLKANLLTKDIPVIFLSAKVQAEDAQRGLDAGGADYIVKPILPPVVVARVEAHVALKVARDFLKSHNWT